jgi:hypothetical protein
MPVIPFPLIDLAGPPRERGRTYGTAAARIHGDLPAACPEPGFYQICSRRPRGDRVGGRVTTPCRGWQ